MNRDEINKAAYFKWERAGRPFGDGTNYWLTAEREAVAKEYHDMLKQRLTATPPLSLLQRFQRTGYATYSMIDLGLIGQLALAALIIFIIFIIW